MNREQLLDIVRSYNKTLEKDGIPAAQNGDKLEHARWMCQHVEAFLLDNAAFASDTKINRWLGFIQGVLWCEGIFTIDEMRDHNR